MSDRVTHVTDADYEDVVLKSEVPVMVDFWAPWCGPCRMVGPVLEEIAEDYGDKVKIVKVNIDDNKQVAGAMGVRSIPTLAVYKGGEVVDLVVGVRPKQELVALLDKALEG